MLAKAQNKLPQLHIVQADLTAVEWSEELDQSFDRIVSAYVLHDFDLSFKMQLLDRLTKDHLIDTGYIIVADIAYSDKATRARAKVHWGYLWSEDEYYWAADETILACYDIGLQCTYRQVSNYAGVFVIKSR
jgi:hypothetical protein